MRHVYVAAARPRTDSRRSRWAASDIRRETSSALPAHPLALAGVAEQRRKRARQTLLAGARFDQPPVQRRRSASRESRRRRTRSRAGRARRRRVPPARRARARGSARPPALPGCTRARGLRGAIQPVISSSTRSDEARLRQASFCGPSPAMRSRTGRPSRREARAAAAMRTSSALECRHPSGKEHRVRLAAPAAMPSPLTVEKSGSTLQAIVRHAVPCHLVAHVLARHDHGRVAGEERPLLTRPAIAPASSRRERAGRSGGESRARDTPARTSGRTPARDGNACIFRPLTHVPK